MEQIAVTLTREDHMILESYKTLAEGLSDYLGSSYEIVLHSLEDLDRSVIKILNGYHTGRREGAPITDLALEMLSRIGENGGTPYVSYFTKNKKEEPLKSSTIAIRGKGGRVIGLLCDKLLFEYTPSRYYQLLYPPRRPQYPKYTRDFFRYQRGYDRKYGATGSRTNLCRSFHPSQRQKPRHCNRTL